MTKRQKHILLAVVLLLVYSLIWAQAAKKPLKIGAIKDTNIAAKHAPAGFTSMKPASAQHPSRPVIFTEGFEAETFPPTGWSVINNHVEPSSNWHRGQTLDLTSWTAEVMWNDNALMNEWLISPSISLAGITNPSLSFDFMMSYYWMVSPYDGADLFALISIDGGSNWIQLWQEEDFGTFTTWEWYNVSLALAAYAGQPNVKLAFQFYGDNGAQVQLDNITIADAPGYPVQVSNPFPINGAANVPLDGSLLWDFGANTNTYDLWFGPTGAMSQVVTDGTAGASGTYDYVSLNSLSSYSWQVISHNTNTRFSTPGPIWHFGTAPAASSVVIGDGTAYNGNGSYPAVYGGWYKNSREQYLVTASELNAGGGGSGNISSVAFNVQALNGIGARPMVIKLGHTTLDALTTDFITGLTPVKTYGIYIPVLGWNEHTFDTSFNWNGTDNIVVEVFYGDLAQNYTYNTSVYYTVTSPTIKALFYYSDDFDANAQTAGTQSYDRPNMLFNMAPYVPATPGPASIISPLDTETGILPTASMNWSAGSGLPTGYKFQYGITPAANDLLPLTDLFGATTYDPAGEMVYDQTYYWKVVPYNGDGECTTAPIWSFTVRSSPLVTPPYLVDFGTVAGDWLPTDWNQYSGEIADPTVLGGPGTGYWYQDDWLNVTDPLNKCAKLNIYNWSGAQGWLVTPPINMPGAGYQLDFDIAYMAWNGLGTPPVMDGTNDYFAVLVGDGSTWTPANIVRKWDNAGGPYVLNNISPSGEHVILDMGSYTGIYQVAFYIHNGLVGDRDNDLMVDNVFYRLPPAGPPLAPALTYPVALTGLPQPGFDVTWTPDPLSGPTDYYNVIFWTDDEGFGNGPQWSTTATSLDPTNPPLDPFGFAQTPLVFDYLDRYNWTVEAYAAAYPAQNAWPLESWFEIEPNPIITIPHTQPFDGANIPGGWTQTYEAGITSNRWTLALTNFAGGIANEMLNTYFDAIGITRLITPPINTAGIGSLAVTFDHYWNDWGVGCTGKLQYSHDLATWYDTSWSIASGGGDVSGNTTVIIPGLAAPVTYVAWVIDGNHFQYDYWYMDNAHFDVPLDHDVGVLSIDMPLVVTVGAFNPMATVTNLGINAESFDVEIVIGTWTDTQQVVGLASGATAQVTFALFTPTVNTGFDVDVTTLLVTDTNPANDTMTSVLWCIDLSKQVYADVAWDPVISAPTGPCTFTLATPGTITDLPVPQAHTDFMPGADWVPGLGTSWWGNDYSTTNFWNIDPVTGLMTDSGDIATAFNGIAFNANTNIWYGATGTELYTFDGVNAPTLVANFTWPDATPWGGFMIGIAYDIFLNVLYGVDIGYDAVFSIDATTGICTPLGFYLGPDLNSAQDCALDQDTGFLYLASCYTTGELFWIDTTNGIGYSIGEHMNGVELTGFAIPYGGGTLDAPVVSLAADGTLSWPVVAGATIYNVYSASDPYGTFTYVGNTTSTSYAAGLAAEKKFFHVTALDGTRRERPQIQNNINLSTRRVRVTPNGRAVSVPASAAPRSRTK